MACNVTALLHTSALYCCELIKMRLRIIERMDFLGFDFCNKKNRGDLCIGKSGAKEVEELYVC